MNLKRIDELFSLAYGNKFDMNKMAVVDGEGIVFIGRKGSNQGVSGYVKPIPGVDPYPAGCLTVALGGSMILATFVQQRPFYTAQNVAVLEPLDQAMPIRTRLYYASCITANRFRYTAFGREANRTLATIRIPAEVPEWATHAPIPESQELAKPVAAHCELSDPAEWGKFRLDVLFELRKGRRLTKRQRTPGINRFVGASRQNNGIRELVGAPPAFSGHVLTVAYNGNSVGWAQYQDQPFLASDDVNILIPRHAMDRYALMFVAGVLRYERPRYTYGFKWNLERMQATEIRLPQQNGEPDWEYMSSYVKGLPFSAVS